MRQQMVNCTEIMVTQGTIGRDRAIYKQKPLPTFFEASMGDQGKLELLANFFPTAFGIFLQ